MSKSTFNVPDNQCLKIYRGKRSSHDRIVTVDGKALEPRLDLCDHSPDGFEWAYGGSGPAQLALAILADCLSDDLALQYYHDFKFAVVAKLPRNGWTLTAKQIQESVQAFSK